MAAAAPGERPDREDLNVTSFKRGEWGSLPVPLDPGFPAVAEALGDADALTEVPQEALMAVSSRRAHAELTQSARRAHSRRRTTAFRTRHTSTEVMLVVVCLVSALFRLTKGLVNDTGRPSLLAQSARTAFESCQRHKL